MASLLPLPAPDGRMAELDAILAAESAYQRQPVERMTLVTVTPLAAVCPICGGVRRWCRRTCSQACAKQHWEQQNREKRSDYWKARHKEAQHAE